MNSEMLDDGTIVVYVDKDFKPTDVKVAVAAVVSSPDGSVQVVVPQ